MSKFWSGREMMFSKFYFETSRAFDIFCDLLNSTGHTLKNRTGQTASWGQSKLHPQPQLEIFCLAAPLLVYSNMQ